MEIKPTSNGTPSRKKPRIWIQLLQPLLIAACLFLWLVFTPMGQLVHVVVWWKTVTTEEAHLYFGIVSIAAALFSIVLTRRSPRTEG